MAVGPLEEAFISIGADPSQADAVIGEVEAALVAIERTAETVGAAIESAFAEAANAARVSFEELDATFADIPASAEVAAAEVEAAFSTAAEVSQAELRDIGGADTFGPVEASAATAATEVEASFTAASATSQGALSRLGSVGSSTFGFLRQHAKLFGLAMGAAALATVAFGVKGAASLEQTQLGFKSLLGSAQAADAFVRQLQQFAANTPFEFQGLANNARQLLAMRDAAGLTQKDILPLLTTIGDLTSVLGQPPEAIDRVIRALSQMASKGKISSEELLQISEAVPGFPVFQALADGLGISTKALQEQLQKGAIPAQKGIAALVQGMKQFPGAAGAMAAQAQTLTGLFSTFKDTIQISLTQAFQPLIPVIKQTLKDAIPVLDTGLKQLAPPLSSVAGTLLNSLLGIFKGIAPGLSLILTGLGTGLQALLPAITAFAHDLSTAFAPLGDLLAALGPALAPIITAIGDIGATVLPPFISGLTAVTKALTPILQLGGELIGILGDALAPVVSRLSGFLQNLGAIAARFFDVFDSSVLSTLLPVFESIADAAARFLAVIGPPFEQAVKAILPPLVQLVELLAHSLADVLTGVLVPLLPAIADALVAVAEAAKVLVPPLIGIVTTLVEQLAPVVKELAPVIGKVLADALKVVAEVFVNIARALAPVIPSLGTVIEALGGALLDVVKALEPTLPELGQAFGEIAVALGDILIALVPLIPPLASLAALLIRDIGAPTIVLFAKSVAILTIALADLVTVVAQLVSIIATNAQPALSALFFDVLEPMAQFIAGTFVAAVQGLAAVVVAVVVPAVQALAAAGLFLWQQVLTPLASFAEAVLIPVFKAIVIIALVPLLAALTAVSIVVVNLWQQVLQPFGSFLLGVFTPIVKAVADSFAIVFQLGVRAAQAAAQGLWNGVLVPFGQFLRAVFMAQVTVAKGALDGLRSAASTLADVAKSLWHNALEPAANFLKGTFNAAVGALAAAADAAAGPLRTIRGVIRSIIDIVKSAAKAVGSLIDKLKSIPGAGIAGDVLSAVGLGAEGGIFTSPTVMMIGEAGKEVLLPLSDPARTLALARQSGLFDVLARAGAFTAAAPAQGGGGGGGTVINLNATVNGNLTPDQARRVGRELGAGVADVLDQRRARVEARIAS